MPINIQCFALGPFQTNCYVVADDRQCWIIDPGMEPKPLLDWLEDSGLQPQAILLTHGHVDHIAGIPAVKDHYPNLPVKIHTHEAHFLTDPMENLSGPFGQPVVLDEADEIWTGPLQVDLAGVEFELIETPGHSPGGVTFYAASHALAIVGDTLFNGSIGRYDFPHSDEQALFHSIRQKLYALPDDTTVLPGHGETTTIGKEKRSNPFVRE